MINEERIREKLNGYNPKGEADFNHFAILVPVVRDQEGRLSLMYEVRARKLDRQPGEICFPGGLIEDGESCLTCALRETEEEIGIPAGDVEVLTEFDPLASTSGSIIHSYVGLISDEAMEKLSPSDAEVAEVFTVSIDELLEAEAEMYFNELKQNPAEDFPYDRVCGGKMYPWRSGISPVPIYDIEGRIIWGLTGRITRQLLKVLKEEE